MKVGCVSLQGELKCVEGMFENSPVDMKPCRYDLRLVPCGPITDGHAFDRHRDIGARFEINGVADFGAAVLDRFLIAVDFENVRHEWFLVSFLCVLVRGDVTQESSLTVTYEFGSFLKKQIKPERITGAP